jgi:hypothetical protein
MLRPTVSRPVSLGIKHPPVTYDEIVNIVWKMRACWFGEPSLTRGRVCRLQLLLALASAVIFGSESRRTRGHILLSQIRYFNFCRLLLLAGLRRRHSTQPTHGMPRRVTDSESYVTTDGKAVRVSWNEAPMWGLRPDLSYSLTVASLLIWSALSDERTGLASAVIFGSEFYRTRGHILLA